MTLHGMRPAPGLSHAARWAENWNSAAVGVSSQTPKAGTTPGEEVDHLGEILRPFCGLLGEDRYRVHPNCLGQEVLLREGFWMDAEGC